MKTSEKQRSQVRARLRRYRESPKGKAQHAARVARPDVRKKLREADRRYAATAKGKAKIRAKGKRIDARDRADATAFIRAMKSVPCMDCGGRFDPVCMDFDHRPGEPKLFGLSKAGSRRPLAMILAEIAKCDIVCANCHRVRTFRLRDHRALCCGPRMESQPVTGSQLSLWKDLPS